MKWKRIARAILYFGIAVVLTTVTFYKLTNETGTDGMMLWRQVTTQWQNWALVIMFAGLGILEVTHEHK